MGIRFIKGTAADALTPAIIVSVSFILYYSFFKLLRMRWGVHRSLAITIISAYITPLIVFLAIKYIFPTLTK